MGAAGTLRQCLFYVILYTKKEAMMLTPEQIERKHQEDLQRLRGFRPIDDDFMRCLFKDNIPLAELVLRIVTNMPDLKITKCETQKDMKRLAGARSICLDAYGTDSTGKKYDLEIQRADLGADEHRARYHSSVMDIENLDANQDFRELPDTYTIFITEKDFFGQGEPIYIIERMNLTTRKPFADGARILYVNGEYRGDSEIGRLMHDFGCTDADNMNYPLMAEKTRYLKESPKGVSDMCKVIEDMRKQERAEGRAEERAELARRMLSAGKYSTDEIGELTGLSHDEIRKLKS
jgi:hypothetical protein